MQLYLATMESNSPKINGGNCEFGLMSFFYLKNDQERFEKMAEPINHILIDSGAHSFQHGLKVDWEEYTHDFASFIARNTNNPKIEGFFEMDVDNVIGYDRVLELRKILESVSDKIIPVWHRNRGIPDFIEMCKRYAGKRIAITGFKNNDILDGQYNLFINEAHRHGCKIHVLGLTRVGLLNELNLGLEDSFDSSSWKMMGAYGNVLVHYGKTNKFAFDCMGRIPDLSLQCFDYINYNCYRKLQEYYKDRDQSV